MPPTLFDSTQRQALLTLAKGLLIPWVTELAAEFKRIYVVKAGTLSVRTAQSPSEIHGESVLEDFKKCNVSLTLNDTVFAKSVVTIKGYQVAQFAVAGDLREKVERACGSATVLAVIRSDTGKIFMEQVPL